VAQLIESAHTMFHRTLLMTLFATGGRRAELANLKITDFDNPRKVIHVQGGKDRKDRDVMLRAPGVRTGAIAGYGVQIGPG
jgi:integrase/recombinase XerD